MKKMKQYAVYLVLGLAIAGMTAGCKKKEKETESVFEQITESETESSSSVEVKEGTSVVKTKLYTSKDKTITITLPDDSWKNTKDTKDALMFESDKGSISVAHISGTTVSSVKLPTSKAEVIANLTAAGKDSTKYEVTEFSQKMLGTKDQYYTVVKCMDPKEGYAYSIGYDLVSDTEIYSVTGLVKEDDEVVVKEIQTAVESFKVLKTAGSSVSGLTGESTQNGTKGEAKGETKVIYDSKGTPITVTKDASGVWSDSTGKTYDMQQYGVMGSDGYWYTYKSSVSQSTTSTESSNTDSSNSNNNDQSSSITQNPNNNNNVGSVSGFYDQDGNYITVTKNSSGNWVDAYGTIYYFGDNGVTDNAGNYYPYGSSSSTGGSSTGENSGNGTGGSSVGGESNGFYDSNGNYVTVIKDANGNWVDSSGNAYTFGETGVTDASGNFYPY